jgi:hypothetical protein
MRGWQRQISPLLGLQVSHSLYPKVHISPPAIDEDEGQSLLHPVHCVRDSVPRILASMPVKAAHVALQTLAGGNAGTARGDWVQRLPLEYASAACSRQCTEDVSMRHAMPRHDQGARADAMQIMPCGSLPGNVQDALCQFWVWGRRPPGICSDGE